MLSLIVLTVLGSIGPWLPGVVGAFGSLLSPPGQSQGACIPPPANSTSISTSSLGLCSTPSGLGGNNPNLAGASPLPSLALPKAAVSKLDSLTGAVHIIENSPQNLSLYGLGVSMRLLGGSFPHDELLSHGGRRLGSLLFWNMQANINGVWIPLVSTSSSFTMMETNATGSFIEKTMRVSAGLDSGDFSVIYSQR